MLREGFVTIDADNMQSRRADLSPTVRVLMLC